MEIIFVSFDKSKEEFEEYRKSMPWIAIPYGDPKRDLLKKEHGIIGIPHLVVMKADGTVIVPNGRADVQKKKMQAYEEWAIKVPN